MRLMDIEIVRQLRARLRQVDRTIRSIDREGPALRDSVVETLRTLRRELKEVGDAIEALQRLERSRPMHPNATGIKHKRRRAPGRSLD
jgi:hypothetical protein